MKEIILRALVKCEIGENKGWMLNLVKLTLIVPGIAWWQ